MVPDHFNPPEVLAPYIAFYGILNVPGGYNEHYVSPPLGFCGIIICLDQEINAQLNGQLFMKGKYCLTGQVTAPMIGDTIGKNRVLMVFIHPFGLHQLFGINMALLTNTTMPLQDLIGKEEADLLIKSLHQAADHRQMIDVLNEFFLSQLPVFEIAPKVKNALEQIHNSKGNISIREIEQTCFITSRSLERHFKIYVGLSPKEYAKIYRFKFLVNFINQNPGVTWNTLCEQNGYYDQSHLTRYFERYLNIKPTGLVNLDIDFINYLLQDT